MTEADWLTSTDPQAMLTYLRGQYHDELVPGYEPVIRCLRLGSDRKLRLWACAACRQALSWSKNLVGDSLRLCDLSDRYADGEITYSELKAFRPTHPDCSWPLRYVKNVYITVLNIINAKPFLGPQAALLRDIFGNPFHPETLPRSKTSGVRAAPEISSTAETSWTKYEPCPWITWHDGIIPKLAQAAYDEQVGRVCHNCNGNGDILLSAVKMQVATCTDCCGSGRISDGTLDAGRLAVLADALEEAGCADEAILRHLRGWIICPRCGGHVVVPPDRCPCGDGWTKSDFPHVRGCWVLDLLLGKE